MELYIDTANLDEIKQAHDLGVLDGVTTNPSLIAKEGIDYGQRLAEICKIVSGPVSAEVIALEADAMVKEGKERAKIAENIVVKLPSTVDGLKACKALSDEGIRTNMTLCFQPLQAMMVAKAGAFLVSPFIGRLDDIGLDGMELIAEIRTIYDNYDFPTEILAASARTVNHVKQAAMIGSDVVTAPPATLKALVKHPLTDKGLEAFLADWAKTGQKIG